MMKILSAVYWRAGLHNIANRHSVLLKIAELNGDTFLLALVCVGADSSFGEIASGYIAEEVAKWYHRNHLLVMMRKKPLWWIKRRLKMALANIHRDLVQHGKKKEVFLGASFVLCVIWREKYLLMQVGEVGASKFRWFREQKLTEKMSRMESSSLFGASHFKSLKTRNGRMKPGQGMLICSDNFSSRLCKRKIFEALKPSELRKENQITKRLSSIADYAGQRGGGDCSAIYMKFSR